MGPARRIVPVLDDGEVIAVTRHRPGRLSLSLIATAELSSSVESTVTSRRWGGGS
jgi:hypothetical protein